MAACCVVNAFRAKQIKNTTVLFLFEISMYYNIYLIKVYQNGFEFRKCEEEIRSTIGKMWLTLLLMTEGSYI